MNRTKSKDSKRRARQAWETINRLLDKWHGEYIEKIVRITKRPELRPVLKQLFFELRYFESRIEKANNLDELESVLTQNAELLDKRVQSLQKRLQQATEERKSATKEEFSALKKQYAQLVSDWEVTKKEMVQEEKDLTDNEMDSIMCEAEQTFRAIEVTMNDVFNISEHFEDILLKIDQDMLNKELVRFRRKRKIRRAMRKVSYFIWGVVILGFLFSLDQSLITSVLIKPIWGLLIITFVASCISVYVFSPVLNKRDVTNQRKHLLASVRDFYRANIQITILAPMKDERIKRMKSMRHARSRRR